MAIARAKEKAAQKQKAQEEEERLKGPPPDPQEDYGGWLEFMKKRWKMQREARKAHRAKFGTAVRQRCLGDCA
jgi:hypothetical protein